MTVVVDASLVLGMLTDAGPQGRWAADQLRDRVLLAPALLPAEVASGLRRLTLAGRLREGAAEMALAELGTLDVDLYPYAPFSDRVWELRDNLTTYDAWYVALAEGHQCPLATLDRRLVTAAGPRCEFAAYRASRGG